MTGIPVIRRGLGAVLVATAAGGAAVFAVSVPSATAAPDPCAASEVAKTIGSVATSMGTYLDAHPQTNQALTTISQQQAGPQSLVALKTYFDANPQAEKDMESMQAPLQTLSAKCKLPVTLPQVLGLMQAAQSQAGTGSASLPNALSAAQAVGASGATAPAQSSPATAITQGAGPLPGPSPRAAG
jgi:heme-binding protein